MRIDKCTVRASPFVGIFSIVTDKIALMPQAMDKKETKGLSDLLGVEVVHLSLAGSSLLGVLGRGIRKRFVFSDLLSDEDMDCLREKGILAERIKGVTALGNLLAVNENGGLCSRILSQQQIKSISSFLGIEVHPTTVAGTDIVGSSVVATSNGFIVHPLVSSDEMALAIEAFGVEGIPTTANYGDRFVANSVAANAFGVMVGNRTTTHEIIRIDEAFS